MRCMIMIVIIKMDIKHVYLKWQKQRNPRETLREFLVQISLVFFSFTKFQFDVVLYTVL